MPVSDVMQVISLALLIFSAALAVVSIKKYRNSRGIDFVLNSESAIDPQHYGLVGADPDLIRNIYRGFGIEGLNDDDCRAYPFMYRMYSHVSRMYFVLSAKRLDYGLDSGLRDEFIHVWMNELALFRDHPAMLAVHRQALKSGNFNTAFLELARTVFDNPNNSIASETTTSNLPIGSPQVS